MSDDKNQDLLKQLNFNVNDLKQICPSIFSTSDDSALGNLGDITIEYTGHDDMLLQQNKYFNKVEEGNRYLQELEQIEQEYLTSKYGKKIYDYLIQKRSDYNSLRTNSGTATTDQGVKMEQLEFYKTLYEDVSGINQDDVNKVSSNINSLENELTRMHNDTELNKRKIQYRHDVSEQVLSQSTKITYIYYVIVLCIFILLFTQNILEIQKHIGLYTIVLLFPLVYRHFFTFLVYVYNIIHERMNVHGPKNAFLNNMIDDLTFFDDYDI